MTDDSGLLNPPHPLLYDDLLRRALIEDLGRAGDLTTDAVVAPAVHAAGALAARCAGRIAGLDAALAVFRILDDKIEAEVCVPDGCDADAGAVLAMLRGSARALLSGERTALNLL
jgi:nicotinate-nucleotide pyrophosphorylase (carboxylating)